MPSFQDELLSELEPFINSECIEILEDDSFAFTSIGKRFPIDNNVVDWDHVPDKKYDHTPPGSFMSNDDVSTLLNFLEKFASDAKIKNSEKVLVFFDNSFDIVIKIDFTTLRAFIYSIFSTPQRTYVSTEDFTWCLVYDSFFDEMFYGKSPENCN